MNMQSWALEWFNQQRNIHVVEPITIIHATGSLPLNASVIEPETTVNSEGIKTRTNKRLFIVNTADLDGLQILRGMKINRGGVYYEIITDKDTPVYDNDPNHLEVVITGKLICS